MEKSETLEDGDFEDLEGFDLFMTMMSVAKLSFRMF
jgi:hypothetical protein